MSGVSLVNLGAHANIALQQRGKAKFKALYPRGALAPTSTKPAYWQGPARTNARRRL